MNYQDFIMALNAEQLAFVEELNNFLTQHKCKSTFEEKKAGLLGSYKYGKPPKALINLLLKKQGLLVRIYGENLDKYRDFLSTLPNSMVAEIDNANECKRLTQNGCSPKCSGYDFAIDKHYQKCRYSCFEFLVTNETSTVIREFVEKELLARA